MSNPILATTNSKLDTRVKEPSGVVPPPSGVGLGSTIDRFSIISNFNSNFQSISFLRKCILNCYKGKLVNIFFIVAEVCSKNFLFILVIFLFLNLVFMSRMELSQVF